MLLILVFSAFCFAKSTIWSDLGCSDEGFLSPSLLPKAIDGMDEDVLSTFLQSPHPLAESSCSGTHTLDQSSDSEQFHLFWECYDSNKACLLPSVNVRSLKTLLHFHPNSKVTIWSNSLQKTLFESRIFHKDVQLRRYNQRFFNHLPSAAKKAAKDIPEFFETHIESQSHFSDLFRLAVLWKFGGVYVDFDSLWVNSVSKLSAENEWIPFTKRKLEKFPLILDEGFLEGGIMKLQRHSAFAETALNNFPKYTEKIAECWSCVGPKHLTETYIMMSEDSNNILPTLVDSSLIFGDELYRANLDAMYSKIDVHVLSRAASTGAVAFHLFTSSGERFPKPQSLINFLFKVSDAKGDLSSDYIPLGALSQRRRTQENSVDYTGEKKSETVRFECDYATDVAGKEEQFKTQWKEKFGTTVITVAQGSVLVTHEGTDTEMAAANAQIESDNGLRLPSFGLYPQLDVEPTRDNIATDAQASTGDGGGDSGMDMMLLVFYALGGVLLVIGFYCTYRVWKGPGRNQKIQALTDSHLEYINNEQNHRQASQTAHKTFTPTPYSPPANEIRPDKRAPRERLRSGSFSGGYEKRSPQSSYTKKDTGGYLMDDEEVYAYGGSLHGMGVHQNGRARGHSNQPKYGVQANEPTYGGAHSNQIIYDSDYDSHMGGGHVDDAYYGTSYRGPDHHGVPRDSKYDML